MSRFLILLRALGSRRMMLVMESAETGDISGERSDDSDKLQDWRRYRASMKSVECQNLVLPCLDGWRGQGRGEKRNNWYHFTRAFNGPRTFYWVPN
jgi:hypothetical protein